jgi:hypothetical protein
MSSLSSAPAGTGEGMKMPRFFAGSFMDSRLNPAGMTTLNLMDYARSTQE